jgi:hypothetical protein
MMDISAADSAALDAKVIQLERKGPFTLFSELSPSWQQELTPAVTAMDAAKLGMAPMEGTCRAGR